MSRDLRTAVAVSLADGASERGTEEEERLQRIEAHSQYPAGEWPRRVG